MGADLCFRGRVDEVLVKHASRLGYRAVASCGASSVGELSGVLIIPRHEVVRESIDKYRKDRGLRVMVVRSREDLKMYPRLIGSVDSVKIDFAQLGEVNKDFLRRLTGLGIPIELEFSEIFQRVLTGSSIDYYHLLLRLYSRGKIRIYVCSGATETSTLVHPSAMFALISVLGVPEALAAKAVYKLPTELASNVV